MAKLFSIAAFITVMAAAASAHAESGHVKVLSKTLTYSAAEVATPQGAARFLARIGRTANSLCGTPSPVVPRAAIQARTCRNQAVARAVDALDAPLVTAAYAGRRVAVASR